MLALERRRAERSRNSFVLMLLDSSGALAEGSDPAFTQRLSTVVSDGVRESDLVGWYQDGAVLGIIFTELEMDGEKPITEVLYSKIVALLHENFDVRLRSKLVVTVHVFPENWGNGRPNRVADLKLYPDVSGKITKNSLPMIVKRAMDIVGSACLLLILSPVLLAIALAIKLTSKGPILFKQERLGQFGKSFNCLKFRTMKTGNDSKIHREYVKSFITGKLHHKDAASHGGVTVFKIKNDPRVTRIGQFLRKTSLDEFPQLWNVLTGEMSLVGPRPPIAYEFEAYDFWHQRRVLEVKPGVTGLWQVTGRSRTSFDDMVRLDLRYTQGWSLWLDLKILLATPMAVINGSGAY